MGKREAVGCTLVARRVGSVDDPQPAGSIDVIEPLRREVATYVPNMGETPMPLHGQDARARQKSPDPLRGERATYEDPPSNLSLVTRHWPRGRNLRGARFHHDEGVARGAFDVVHAVHDGLHQEESSSGFDLGTGSLGVDG